jgi:hypothetical protein
MDITHLPRKITGPAAWVGPEMAADERHWLYRLTPADIADLENAARHCLSLRDVGGITAADFPLASFAGHLRPLQAKLLHGNGITKQVGRIAENLGALDVRLSPQELADLSQAFPPGAAAGTRYPAGSMKGVFL